MQPRKSSGGSSKSGKRNDVSDKASDGSEHIIIEVIYSLNVLIYTNVIPQNTPLTATSPLWYTHSEEEYIPPESNEDVVI